MVNIPKIVFIVPYRNRAEHQKKFITQMTYILEDYSPELYEIYFVHQNDTKNFNRGAMKNLGFLYIKQKYPNHYKNMTFVFNDVDITPKHKNLLHYETTSGIVKHFYGYKFALGGLFSIQGEDFERICGFPNFWGWGFEDNVLQKRALENKLKINRDTFFVIHDTQNINQENHGIVRLMDNMVTHKLQDSNNNFYSITDICFNEEIIENSFYYVNVTSWKIPENENNIIYETRKYFKNIQQNKVNMKNILHAIRNKGKGKGKNKTFIFFT